MALGHEGLGKIVGPACFGAFHLDKSGADGFTVSLGFATLDEVDDIREALVDLFLVAGIPAEEEIVHVEAIQHDLGADGSNGANALDSRSGIGARRALLNSGNDVHD